MARDRQGREEGASTKVVQLLAALPPEERIVLEALSFAYSECSAADLTLCLSGMSRITVGHRVTTLEVRRALRGLEEAGVVEINHYGGAWIDPEIADEVSLKACESKEGVALANAARRALSHTRSRFGTSSSAPLVIAGVRDTRLAYFSQNVQHLRAAASVARQEVDRPGTTLYRLAFSPFSAESFARLAPPFRKAVTESVLPVMASHMLADRGFIPYLLAANLAADSVPALFLSDLLMLHGRFHEAEQLWTDDPTAMTLVREGWTLFLAGDCDGAIVAFDQGLEWMQRQGWYRGDCWYRTIGGVFFVMALLQRGRQEDVKQADRILDRARSTPGWAVAYSALRGVVDMQLGRRDRPRIPEELSGFDTPDRSTRLPVASAAATLALIAVYWQAPEAVARFLPLLHDLRDHAESAGFAWLAIELRALIRRATPGGGETPDEAEQSFRETSGIAPLVDLVRCPSLWELGLDRLETLAGNPLFDSQGAAFRLAWRLGFRRPDDPASFEFIPYEQKRRANGEWTRGRRMRMDALLGEHQPSYLDEHDVRICESAVASGSWSRASKHFEPETLARVLIGHPRVFLAANPSTRIDLSLEAPALRIASRDDGFRVEFGMRGTTESAASVSIVQRTPSRWAVLCADVRQQRLAQVLEDGMTVPREGLERLRGIVHRLAGSVNVESDDEAAIGDVATCEADAIPHVHIVPEGEGLRVEICVYPFGVESTIAQPGSEPRLMLSRQDGELVRTRRDPKDEVERAEAVITACPALDEAGREDWQWIMGDLEQCLELLLQLRDLDPAIPVEWPAGESFRLTSPVSEKGVSLRIRRDRDWFAVSGEVQVDEELTLSFGELLSKARGRVGRFVPLGEGRFLALTDEFRQRLGALEAMGRRVGDDLTVNPFAAEAMEELIENVGAVHADADWSAHILKLGKLRNWTPELPANLEAELRDYQLDGFRWLARLSEWGAGGCLADDMGLGKTVQALAVMLLRADKGPALVVAPTSVVHNWEQEAARFAPTLSVHVFGQGNRTEALAALKPGSLLVCTYGLLQTEIDRLEEVEFATICLDEAQAIKNGMTKRSKAAMRLKGAFRMVTTGTPVENHLIELWTLFRFLNPGLLGSREQFGRNYAIPIEKNQDSVALDRLRRIVRPFILRRLKAQVLTELPPRTEIEISVELPPQSRAFYEALRRDSLERLAELKGTPGQTQIQILAEITKLRLACCSPQLVNPDTTLQSAKMPAFLEIVDELRENGHRALVFSQFVKHLTLLRGVLDRQGVSYQYLDGSTPAKARAARVTAFQEGNGDLFLISLKAGGTGLNLTAADYVVHMDPWWNPAVEDQASDRAHRIGQERPVTIYRIVARDTIEDRIIALHREKRKLVDGLLADTAMPKAVSAEELIALLREDM